MSARGDDRGLFEALVGDGRPLLALTGVLLILFGLFAFFLSATRHCLPHDVIYLGMSQDELCAINECRIVHFMIHDRVSFGGSLVAIGVLYLWLVEFPLRAKQAWAWWVFVVSGALGFGSFLLYLGYGYLDTWHGIGTLGLLPIFGLGLFRTYFSLEGPLGISSLVRIWQALLLTGLAGFGTAIGVHPAIGYMEFSHLAPAYAGAALFAAGMVMTFPRMWRRYSVEGAAGCKAVIQGN